MDNQEQTALERRVQAHEELLTALIAAVGLENPAVMTRLESTFVGDETEPGGARTEGDTQRILRMARHMVGAN